jgi:hypothetical protein
MIMIAPDDEGGADVLDTHGVGEETPLVDDSSDVRLLGIESVDGRIKVRLGRALHSNDADDHNSFERPVFLLFAWHASSRDLGTRHQRSGVSAQPVSLYAGVELGRVRAQNTAHWLAHAALMLIAWGALPFPLVVSARYVKPLGPAWFDWHRMLASGIVLLSLVGVVFAVAHHEAGRRQAKHLQSPHSMLGVILLALGAVQSLLGVVVGHMRSPVDRTSTPLVDRVHHWLGRFVALLALVTLSVGLAARNSTAIVCVVIAVVVTIVVLLALEFQIGTPAQTWCADKPDQRDSSNEQSATSSEQQSSTSEPEYESQSQSDSYADADWTECSESEYARFLVRHAVRYGVQPAILVISVMYFAAWISLL